MKKILLFAAAVFATLTVNAQTVTWELKGVDSGDGKTLSSADLTGSVVGSTTITASDADCGEGLVKPGNGTLGQKNNNGNPYYEDGSLVVKWAPSTEYSDGIYDNDKDGSKNISKDPTESYNGGVSIVFGIEEADEAKVLDINSISFKIVRFGTDAVRANVKLIGTQVDGTEYDSDWLITKENWSTLTGSEKEGAWVTTTQDDGTVIEEGFRPARENGKDDENTDGWNILNISNENIPNLPTDLYIAKIVVTYGGVKSNKQIGLGEVKFNLGSSETGIFTVKSEKASNVIYNVAGQQVDSNYKGLVIKNGKKMIQK